MPQLGDPSEPVSGYPIPAPSPEVSFHQELGALRTSSRAVLQQIEQILGGERPFTGSLEVWDKMNDRWLDQIWPKTEVNIEVEAETRRAGVIK